MRSDPTPPPATDDDVERLSEELRQQVELAKDRISDRYGKLLGRAAFEPDPDCRNGSLDS